MKFKTSRYLKTVHGRSSLVFSHCKTEREQFFSRGENASARRNNYESSISRHERRASRAEDGMTSPYRTPPTRPSRENAYKLGLHKRLRARRRTCRRESALPQTTSPEQFRAKKLKLYDDLRSDLKTSLSVGVSRPSDFRDNLKMSSAAEAHSPI